MILGFALALYRAKAVLELLAFSIGTGILMTAVMQPLNEPTMWGSFIIRTYANCRDATPNLRGDIASRFLQCANRPYQI